jgi:hypothetical protein
MTYTVPPSTVTPDVGLRSGPGKPRSQCYQHSNLLKKLTRECTTKFLASIKKFSYLVPSFCFILGQDGQGNEVTCSDCLKTIQDFVEY